MIVLTFSPFVSMQIHKTPQKYFLLKWKPDQKLLIVGVHLLSLYRCFVLFFSYSPVCMCVLTAYRPGHILVSPSPSLLWSTWEERVSAHSRVAADSEHRAWQRYKPSFSLFYRPTGQMFHPLTDPEYEEKHTHLLFPLVLFYPPCLPLDFPNSRAAEDEVFCLFPQGDSFSCTVSLSALTHEFTHVNIHPQYFFLYHGQFTPQYFVPFKLCMYDFCSGSFLSLTVLVFGEKVEKCGESSRLGGTDCVLHHILWPWESFWSPCVFQKSKAGDGRCISVKTTERSFAPGLMCLHVGESLFNRAS